MNRKTLQKPMAMALALTMVCGLGGIRAFADETEPVVANDVGTEEQMNVAVEGSIVASGDRTQFGALADATKGGDVSLDVEKDVSVSADGNAHGAEVYAINEDSEAIMTIGGDLTSTSEGGEAVGAETFAIDGGTASLTVGGDAEVTGGSVSAISVNSNQEGSEAKTEVKGNVMATVVAGSGSVVQGARVGAENGGASELVIGGNLTAVEVSENHNSMAYGVRVQTIEGTSDVSIGGDVTVSGDVAVGVIADAGYYHVADEKTQTVDTVVVGNSSINMDIGGDIKVTGDNPTCGFGSSNYGEESKIQATVGGSILVETEDKNGIANGAIMEVHGAETSLTVEGDIIASGESGNGIWTDLHSYEGTEGLAIVQVGGNVSGQDTGLFVTLYGEDDSSEANVTVEGTLSAKSENGTAVVVSENVTPDNLKLTVWKIDLDKDGNAVTQLTDWTRNGKPITESTEVSKAIEENIEYIIKVEPTQADLFAGTQATAREGENVAIKLTVPAGYKLNGAFTDEGKSVELLKDSNGNYYVVVPRGGGIYLSAKLEALPVETQATSLSTEYGRTETVSLVNGCCVLTLSARQRSFTFIRSTLEQHAKKNDILVIRTDEGSYNQSISELLSLNEKAVNFRFELTDEAVEIYLDGQMMKTVGLTAFV